MFSKLENNSLVLVKVIIIWARALASQQVQALDLFESRAQPAGLQRPPRERLRCHRPDQPVEAGQAAEPAATANVTFPLATTGNCDGLH